MSKVTVASLKAERETLLKLIADLTAKSDSKPKKRGRPSKSPATGAQFVVTRDIEKSLKYGVDYCTISFVGCSSKHDMSEEQIAGLKAIKAVRWGQQGKGKFRWNGSAWSGRLDMVPSIVK